MPLGVRLRADYLHESFAYRSVFYACRTSCWPGSSEYSIYADFHEFLYSAGIFSTDGTSVSVFCLSYPELLFLINFCFAIHIFLSMNCFITNTPPIRAVYQGDFQKQSRDFREVSFPAKRGWNWHRSTTYAYFTAGNKCA